MEESKLSLKFVLVTAMAIWGSSHCTALGKNPADKARAKLSPDVQLSHITYKIGDTNDYEDIIKELEAFAKEHGQHDLSADAHLTIAKLLVKKPNPKDVTQEEINAAIKKLKWVGANFPNNRIRQYTSSIAPSTMIEEWADYVERHPILIKDYVWYHMAELCRDFRRYDNALAAYNYILSKVKPDKLPVTRNRSIVNSFRLHKSAFEQKLSVLRKMKKIDEFKRAAEDYEKLYPKAAWKKLEQQASAAYKSYAEESKGSVS